MDLSNLLAITELLSGMSKGRNDANTQNDILGISGANAANNAQLGYDQFNLNAPGERLAQSRIASIGKNAQPVTAGSGVDPASGKKVVNWQGGVNTPNLYDPETQRLASEVEHQHLADQLAGPKKPTPIPPTGQSNTMDKVMGVASTASTGASILKLLGLFGGGGGQSTLPVSGHFNDMGEWVTDPNPVWGGAGGGMPNHATQDNPYENTDSYI